MAVCLGKEKNMHKEPRKAADVKINSLQRDIILKVFTEPQVDERGVVNDGKMLRRERGRERQRERKAFF